MLELCIFGLFVGAELGGMALQWLENGGASNQLGRLRRRPQGPHTSIRGVVEALETMRSPIRGHVCVGARVELHAGRHRVSTSVLQDFVLRTTTGLVVVRGRDAFLDRYAPPANVLESPLPPDLAQALAAEMGRDARPEEITYSELALFPGEEAEVTGRLLSEPPPAALRSGYRGTAGVPTIVAAGRASLVRPAVPRLFY